MNQRPVTVKRPWVSVNAARFMMTRRPVTAIPSPEHRLYERLAETDPDSAHSRYNALVRRLVSFENAAECAVIREE